MKSVLRSLLGPFYSPLKEIYYYILKILFKSFLKRKGILVYLGINTGESFDRIYYKYKRVIGFEPNPENFYKLKKYNSIDGVTIYPYAVSDVEGEYDFYLPNNKNNDASASLSDFSDARKWVNSVDTIKVKTVVLSKILKENNIKFIDKYISDIEGYDFTVLKTIEFMIKEKKIMSLQVEAVQNHVKNPFKSVTNFENEFDDLLLENYNKLARGWGILEEGHQVPIKSKQFIIDLLYNLK